MGKAKNKKRKLAIFDIDGTIFRSSLMVELMKTLVYYKIFPKEAEDAFDREYFAWADRRGPYQHYIDKMVDVFTEEIVGCKEEDIKKMSKRVAEYFRDRKNVYTRDLIEKVRKNHFLLSISGSPIEVVSEYNKYLKFDAVFGTIYGLDKNRIYTGKMILDGAHQKEKIFNQFLSGNDFDLKNSIGVGDTQYDAAFLNRVGHPIVFNPNASLEKLARRKGWKIVVERKDVIYELNKKIKVKYYYAK
jgi:HAD superfamily hydrolase (TIGR01490 family)